MSPPCVYHPALAAVGPCAECGAPVCKHCAQVVGDQYACPKCADSVRARLGVPAAPQPAAAAAYPPLQGYHAQPAAPPPPQGYHAQPTAPPPTQGYPAQAAAPREQGAAPHANYGQAPPYAPQQSQPAYGDPSAYPGQVHYAAGDVQIAPDIPLDATEKRRLMLAAGVSFAVAAICAIVIMTVVHAAGPDAAGLGPVFGYAAMYVMSGVGVSLAFCKIADVGGDDLIAAIASGIMLAGWIVGHIYYVFLSAVGHGFGQAFASLGAIPVFHWFLVLICLGAVWGTTKYQQ